MKKVTRKELVDNVLSPAFKNENFEDVLGEIIIRLRADYPEVAKGLMDAAKETHRKLKDAT
jgi:hypothetical protein